MTTIIEGSCFDYSALPADARDEVREAAVRIKVRMARTAEDIIEIGRDLIGVKKALGHGHFLKWVEAEFGMSESSALRFQRVAERFGSKSVTVTDFQPSALYALSAPSTPDELVEEVTERAAEGETFTAADIKAMKEEWEAEKKALSDALKEHKDKVKDAKATETDIHDQLQSLHQQLSELRDERDTLQHELEQGAPRPPAPALQQHAPDAMNDLEVRERQIEKIMKAWNDASRDAREEFLDRIDQPVFDSTRSGRRDVA